MSLEVQHYRNGNIRSVMIMNEKGELHNTEGPAIQGWHENGQEEYRAYYVNDCIHNAEGPAAQNWHENGQEYYRAYHINDKELTKEEWEKEINSVPIEWEGKTVNISRESAKALNLI